MFSSQSYVSDCQHVCGSRLSGDLTIALLKCGSCADLHTAMPWGRHVEAPAIRLYTRGCATAASGRSAKRYTLWRMWIGRNGTPPKGANDKCPCWLERKNRRNGCNRNKNAGRIAIHTALHAQCATVVPFAATTFPRRKSCRGYGLYRTNQRFGLTACRLIRPRVGRHHQ